MNLALNLLSDKIKQYHSERRFISEFLLEERLFKKISSTEDHLALDAGDIIVPIKCYPSNIKSLIKFKKDNIEHGYVEIQWNHELLEAALSQ